MAAPIRVTPELLQQAWQARRRQHWPATFDACMADGMLRRLVRAEAVRLAQAALARVQRAPTTSAPATVRQPTTPAPMRAPALRDLKRAAAGDASDD